jgi:ABC-2 type transport system ATP-binding protein
MIETINLSKSYAQFVATKNVSFKFDTGDVVGLLGPNGAGKTTTIRMLTTFIPPTSGTAKVAGFDIVKESQLVRKNIGYLPETPPLYPEMKVKEYLEFVAKIKGVERKLIGSYVDEAIQSCFISNVANKVCSALSKGYRQRVGLAQALVHKPKVIILDEPTSGLDPAQIIEIRQLIARLKGQHTVILSTHILPEVTETCNKVVIIANGSVVAQGELGELTKEMSLEQRFMAAISNDEFVQQ